MCTVAQLTKVFGLKCPDFFAARIEYASGELGLIENGGHSSRAVRELLRIRIPDSV